MFNSFYFMSCYENLETHKIGRSVCIESSAKEVQSVAILEISSFSRKRFLLKKYNVTVDRNVPIVGFHGKTSLS